MGAHIRKEGWRSWNNKPNAEKYTILNILCGDDNWNLEL